MSLRKLAGLRVVVSGASSGIGRALAMQLAQAGASVLTTARRESRLTELKNEFEAWRIKQPKAHGEIATLCGDLTDPQHRSAIYEYCHDRWQALDVLVNNAGAGAIGRFEDAQPARLRTVMEIDFFAPVELTRLMLPLLRRGIDRQS